MSIDLASIHPGLWRAHQLSNHNGLKIPTGFDNLDQELPGGGWPTQSLTELLIQHHGIGELRFLMPVLCKLSAEQKQLIFLGAPLLPMTAVFQQFGVDLNHISWIQTTSDQDRLWAIEQVLQSDSFGVLITWLPEDKKLCSTHVLRRLQHHATRSQGLSFVFRPVQAQLQPSPAPLRVCLKAQSLNSLCVHLVKRKGPVLEKPLLIKLPTTGITLQPIPQAPEPIHALDRPELQTELRNYSAA